MSAELALLELIRVHGKETVEAAIRKVDEDKQPVPRGSILCNGCKTLRSARTENGGATRCKNDCISPLLPEELKS